MNNNEYKIFDGYTDNSLFTTSHITPSHREIIHRLVVRMSSDWSDMDEEMKMNGRVRVANEVRRRT